LVREYVDELLLLAKSNLLVKYLLDFNGHLSEVGGKLHTLVGGEGQPPADFGHWALGIGNLYHAPCPIPHALKLHPLVGGVFY